MTLLLLLCCLYPLTLSLEINWINLAKSVLDKSELADGQLFFVMLKAVALDVTPSQGDVLLIIQKELGGEAAT